jgi:signal transduction histidine kinase
MKYSKSATLPLPHPRIFVAGLAGLLRGAARPWPGRASHTTKITGAILFGRIRLNLTLWYCGVLAAALLVFGTSLYIGAEQLLFSRVQTQLAERALHWEQFWQANQRHACNQHAMPVRVSAGIGAIPTARDVAGRPPALPPGIRATLYAACYGPAGVPLIPFPAPMGPSSFYTTNLVSSAILHGSASDTVDGGEGVGALYRLAQAVPAPHQPHQILGVVLLGESVEGQTEALHTLLNLLLIFGAVALLCAALGGHWLSKRALAPARLAYAHQQDFIAAAAHELRTPLTLLRADAEVLLRGRDRFAPEDASLLEDIVTEAAHMAAFASNMLTMARLDAGTVHLEREVVDLVDVARAAARRSAAFAAEHQVQIRLDAPGTVLVLGDRLMLDQVVLILVDNAVKYSGAGAEVVLRGYVEHTAAVLQVQDMGIGISAEHLPRLGQRFFRADAARSRNSGGTGLGLAIAQQFVRQHAGVILIDSTPGHGTTVTVRLPSASAPPRHGLSPD